jgi:hypothetical protein
VIILLRIFIYQITKNKGTTCRVLKIIERDQAKKPTKKSNAVKKEGAEK